MCTRTRVSMRWEAQTIHVNRRDDPGDAAMDVIGPVCTREEEMEGSFPFIFTATLLSTGYMMAKAYKKCSAAAFADFLFEFIMRFGVPARLITDQGSNFIGKVGEFLAAKLRYRHVVLSKGNSQGNAICERRHRVVNKGLMCQLLQNAAPKKNWHLFLDGVVFSINTTPNKRGHSPHTLLMGHQPRIFGDLTENKTLNNADAPIDAFRTGLRVDDINRLRAMHRAFMVNDRHAAAVKANKRMPARERYAVGDCVWCKIMAPKKGAEDGAQKYAIKWTGPCIITRVYERANVYEIFDLGTSYANKIHGKMLAPCGCFHANP